MHQKILIALLFCCQLLLAQDPFYIKYSTAEGLPSNNVYSVFQDEKKCLWFTTDAGVVKYDSHSFTLYNTDNGLSDNEVFQIKKDHKDRLWFLTLNGKPSYLHNGKVYNPDNSKMLRELSSSSMMMDFYEDSDNNAYFVFRFSPIKRLEKNGKISSISTKRGSYSGVWSSNNSLFLLTDIGIYDTNGKYITRPYNSTFQYRIFHAGDKHYFNLLNELHIALPDGKTMRIATLPERSEIINVFAESDRKLWICSRDGVYLLRDGVLSRKYFANYAISAMTRDFEGGYWLSTLKKGVLYVPSFEVFENRFDTNESMRLNCISINKDKQVWVGSDGDFYYVGQSGRDYQRHILPPTHVKNEVANIRFFGDYTYISNKAYLAQLDRNGNMKSWPLSSSDVLVDSTQIYLAATTALRMPFNAQKPVVPIYTLSYNFVPKRSLVFSKGRRDEIWTGTNFGLYYYKYRNAEPMFMGENEPKFKATVKDLLYDGQRQQLLVATNSQGVLLVKDLELVRQFSKKNGINSNSCNSVKKISDDDYLIGSINGLNLLTLHGESYEVRNLNAILGLKNKNIKDIDFLDGTVYLITDTSLLYFNLRNIERKKTYPLCYIQSLVNHETAAAAKDNKFSYQNNDVSIKYIGISYSDAKNLTYFYRLDGRNTHWTQSKETQINYSSLAPGKYTFCVYCVDGLQLKSNIQRIAFEIQAPFWQENWFILLSILVFSLLVYWFIGDRLKSQRERFEKERSIIQTERDKAQLEKEMIDLEQKALRLQMNPHFIFNALNTIKGYYSEGDAIRASSYISKFSKLLRMLLENTQQAIPLDKEIEMLELYIALTKTRYPDKFEHELTVDPALNRNETAIPTLLLQPIVENAIIHGLAPKTEMGLLKIAFIKKGQLLECIIEDDGIGREASKTSQKNQRDYESKAIDITRERIALFSENSPQATFEIIDLKTGGLPSGTKVTITIPLISIW